MTETFYGLVRQGLEDAGWQPELALPLILKSLERASAPVIDHALRVAVQQGINVVLSNGRQTTRRALAEAVKEAPPVVGLSAEVKAMHDIRRAQKFERGREAVRSLLEEYRLSDGTCLGDADAIKLAFEAEKREKLGRANLAEARFLRAIASSLGDKTAREVFSHADVHALYQESQKEAVPA